MMGQNENAQHCRAVQVYYITAMDCKKIYKIKLKTTVWFYSAANLMQKQPGPIMAPSCYHCNASRY